MKDKELPPYFKDYLDERFNDLDDKISSLTKIIIGNGRKGLIQRVIDIESFNAKIIMVAGLLMTVLVMTGISLWNFFLKVWDHIK